MSRGARTLACAAVLAGMFVPQVGVAQADPAEDADGAAASDTSQQPSTGQPEKNDSGETQQKGDDAGRAPSASADPAQKGAAQPDASAGGQQQPAKPSDAGQVDHKPQLAQVLSYNDKADSQVDELRMDFVLRVAHGDVNPNCVPLAGSDGQTGRDGWGDCGLQLFYSYNPGNPGNEWMRRLSYMNTLGSDTDTQAAKQTAATQWASNGNQQYYFTIHGVTTSADGKYDYLSISAAGDVDYPNDPAHDQTLGGAKVQEKIYAVVHPGTVPVQKAGGAYIKDSSGLCTNPGSACSVRDSGGRFDARYATDIAKDLSIHAYSHICQPDGKTGGCAGPISFIGHDSTPSMWSGRQSNWGMHVQNGFSGRSEAPGTAPAKSFFVQWSNPVRTVGNKSCSNTSTFYYEWLGLKDGKWMPVTSLTKTAMTSKGSERAGNMAVSYNAPGSPDSGRTIMGDGDAQNADGSIDFAKAKAEQGFDGYFKLVSWPTSTDKQGNISPCVSDVQTGDNGYTMHQVFNPLYGNEQGVTEDMALNDPGKADQLIDEGQTVDTAFEDFAYNDSAPAPVAAAGNPAVPAGTPVPVPSSASPRDANPTPAKAAVDHRPKMEKMLGYNERVEFGDNVLRADFVLRVGHGDVDPGCVGLGTQRQYPNDSKSAYGRDGYGTCGLQLFYGDGIDKGKMHRVSYFNTLRSANPGQDSDQALKEAALVWASNRYPMYTIHDLQSDGQYDYLTISLAADATFSGVDVNALGGVSHDLHIYAAVNGSAVGSQPISTPACGGYPFEGDCGVKVPGGISSSNSMADITTGKYAIRLYSSVGCSPSSKPEQCDGPATYAGWHGMHGLWSNGQANWGLVTDYGFKGRNEADGVAPAKSFFVDWHNPAWNGLKSDHNCGNVGKYYFQWMGMDQVGNWVPVKALTAQAQSANIHTSMGTHTLYTDYNLKGSMMAAGDAQRPDGSIDFAKAKAEQPELSGYFKLVTWPVSTNGDGSMTGCTVGDVGKVFNPLANDPQGVTADMAAQDQAKTQTLVDEGWTVGTAFEGYSYAGNLTNQSTVQMDAPQVPHTVKETGDLKSGAAVKLTGTVNDLVPGASTLKVYAAFKAPGQADGDLNATDPSNLVGQTTINGTGQVPYSLSVDPGRFKQYVAQGDDYRFTAVLTDAAGRAAQPAQLDAQVDITSATIAVGDVHSDQIKGTLDPRDSHKDCSQEVVVVTWPDGTTTQSHAQADGSWSFSMKEGVQSGQLKIDATDQAGNESKTQSAELKPSVRHLPMTGSYLLWVTLAALVLIVAGYAGGRAFVRRRMSK